MDGQKGLLKIQLRILDERGSQMTNCYKVEDVVANSLCTGCGTCVGMCPMDLIKMWKDPKEGTYIPILKESKYCNECRLCIAVCPGHSLDLDKLNLLVFGRISDYVLLGNHTGCYVGHSTDERLRWNSSSGGLATALLIFALEEGIIDHAVVTRMNKKQPLEPEVFMARTTEEVISSSKSKYCPVPANVRIKETLNLEGKFAIVGLPCHIHGMRKAEAINKKLQDRMVLHIGLFCSHTVNFFATTFLLQRLNISQDAVAKIDYRGKGWPGGMTVQLKNGRKIFVPYLLYWNRFFSSFIFTPKRCMLCGDATNEFADISIGDAWIPHIVNKGAGESLIITRTDSGERILREALSANKIEITKATKNDVARAQLGTLLHKKRKLSARISIYNKFRKPVPDISWKFQKPTASDYPRALLTFLGVHVLPKQIQKRLLDVVPPLF